MVDDAMLVNSTGNGHVDRILQGSIGIFEAVFPERVRAYYVEGSYADKSGLLTSDVDVTIVFKNGFRDEMEQQKAARLAKECTLLSAIELDLDITCEAALRVGMSPTLKQASQLIYGEDIRDTFPLVSIDEWMRDRMHSSYWRIGNLFSRSGPLLYPLDYPDPLGEFYGYTARKVKLLDGSEVNSTKNLIRLVGWIATAIIALKCGKYVARKSDCARFYRECIGDEWTSLVEDVYEKCRNSWLYLIPEREEDRNLLKDICHHTLSFENHFLTIYKPFLLSELRSVNQKNKEFALWLQAEIAYKDQEIMDAVNRALEG